MRRLICSADERFGKRGLEDFKCHPWFKGIEWDNIRDGQYSFLFILTIHQHFNILKDKLNASLYNLLTNPNFFT